MATLSVVPPREEIRNHVSNLSAGRAALVILALPLFAQAWQTSTPPAAGCQKAGQIFGWDVLEHKLTLKSDSAHYFDFRYDASTTFMNDGVALPPEDLNIDDRLCVEAFRPDAKEIASRVEVTFRSEIDARDKQELVRWQAESLFGTVKSLDTSNHKITVSVSASSEVSVDVAGPVAFWILPAAADDPAEAIRGGWETLVAGDDIYVRGERVPGTLTMRARLIVSGGFQSFTGSIDSIEPLTSLVRLRDFRSGRSRSVHFDFMPIYLVGKTTAPDAHDRRLYPGNVGDLKEGDSVLIMGRENNQTGGIDAFLLITGFSPGGIVQPSAGQPADWIFQAVGFGRR
jgi:hypothetical protein